LLAEAHAGNPAALGRICGRYHERLSNLARKYLASCPFPVVSAEDAAQSALVTFHNRFLAGQFPDLQDRTSLWNLLANITRRKVFQAIRKEERQKRGGGQVVPLQTANPKEDQDAVGNEPASREPDPLEVALEADLLDRLFQLLNDTNRQIAWLRLAGCTNAEIATQLERTEKSVERRLDTIREELRQLGDEN